MSTYIYVTCKDHDPELVAEDESGQHLYDLPQLRADIANRDAIIAAVALESWPSGSFRRNTFAFLAAHPRCELGIRDEYGREHPLVEPPDQGRALSD